MSELMAFSKVKVTPTGLTFKESTTFDEWVKAMAQLRTMEGALQWWIGDALNFGEAKYGEMYAQAADETGYSKGTLANLKYVAARVETSRRSEKVPWSKHAAVAPLEPKQQIKVLKQAADLTVSGVRDEVNKLTGHEAPERELCPECGRPMPKGD